MYFVMAIRIGYAKFRGLFISKTLFICFMFFKRAFANINTNLPVSSKLLQLIRAEKSWLVLLFLFRLFFFFLFFLQKKYYVSTVILVDFIKERK